MIDSIFVPTSVHFVVGMLTVVTNLLAVIVAGAFALRRRVMSGWGHASFILAQVVLAVQILIGIKLLDQGMGPLQLYIHYLGGTGAIFFYLLYYWLPERLRSRPWVAVACSGLAFLFVIMAFGIGESYDPTA